MVTVGLQHFLVLAALLFTLGVVVVAAWRVRKMEITYGTD